jgi:hypothetical protein
VTQFSKGDRVLVEMLQDRPSVFGTRQTVRRTRGIYLGIPKFETTLAHVQVGERLMRLPLEYLTLDTGE